MEQPTPEIIFEDQYLIAINKPAGLLSVRDGYDASLPYSRQVLEPRYGRLWNVHRLDRDTSGLLLLARSPESHRALNTLFEQHLVHKLYQAIIIGIPPWHELLIDLPLKVDGDRRHRTIVSHERGKPAQTGLRILHTSIEHALVEAHPFTGYTHQIRAHLFALGFPVLADPLYFIHPSPSFPTSHLVPPINRLALHAFSISLSHPFTGISLSLVAPFPIDFQKALQNLSLT